MKTHLSTVILFLYTVCLAAALNQFLSQERITSDSYLTYLSTNVAKFLAFTTHQVTCPQDLSLLHGEHLLICLDDSVSQEELEKLSNQSLQRYFEASEKHSDWIHELQVPDQDGGSQCTSGEDNTAVINDKLGKIPLTEFWPFNSDVIKLNERLAILFMNQELVEENKSLKEQYFEPMAKLQNTTLLPLEPDNVVLSFNDGQFIKTLVDKNYAHNSVEFMFSGGHLYEEPERTQLHEKAKAALDLIKGIDEELYRCIIEAVAAIGFYKGEDQSDYSGGTTIALLGAIWMDPPISWSAVQIADGIVHEFIHTALNEAELVHGMVADDSMRKKVKTTSAIRREHRPYDKSFHAAYVSTGLVLFHAHALKASSDEVTREQHTELLDRLLETLGNSITELKEQQEKHQLLNASGKAMLKQMVTVAERSGIIKEEGIAGVCHR